MWVYALLCSREKNQLAAPQTDCALQADFDPITQRRTSVEFIRCEGKSFIEFEAELELVNRLVGGFDGIHAVSAEIMRAMLEMRASALQSSDGFADFRMGFGRRRCRRCGRSGRRHQGCGKRGSRRGCRNGSYETQSKNDGDQCQHGEKPIFHGSYLQFRFWLGMPEILVEAAELNSLQPAGGSGTTGWVDSNAWTDEAREAMRAALPNN